MSRLDRWFRRAIAAVVMGPMLLGGAPWSIRAPEVSAEFKAVPPGFKVVYVSPGLRASVTAFASSIHCTNVDSRKTARITVEFYSSNGALLGSGSIDVGPAQTRTVSANQAGSTALFADDVPVMLSDNLEQGSARVLASGTTKLACTAQVLHATDTLPDFIYTVPHFSPAGKH